MTKRAMTVIGQDSCKSTLPQVYDTMCTVVESFRCLRVRHRRVGPRTHRPKRLTASKPEDSGGTPEGPRAKTSLNPNGSAGKRQSSLWAV
jgi:hypothetical protein